MAVTWSRVCQVLARRDIAAVMLLSVDLQTLLDGVAQLPRERQSKV
jgi:hypothetical protein